MRRFQLSLFNHKPTFPLCSEGDNEYQVVMGGVDLDQDENMDQTIPVIETIAHEDYRETDDALYNDIGLSQLSYNVLLSTGPYAL